MRLTIAAIGKLKTGPEADLIQSYQKRSAGIGRTLGFSGLEITEAEAPSSLAGKKRQAHEGALLLRAASSGARLVALDERGQNVTSQDFAALLANLRDQGTSNLVFVIGGADGLCASVTAKASRTISFGAATWPHLLVRVMLTEQIYRAMTILAGHPYHRA